MSLISKKNKKRISASWAIFIMAGLFGFLSFFSNNFDEKFMNGITLFAFAIALLSIGLQNFGVTNQDLKEEIQNLNKKLNKLKKK